ncbi:hypothetical protein [Methylobacterium sp. D54C]
MFERLSLPGLTEAVDGAWGLLEAGSRAAGDACSAVSALAGEAVAGLPTPSFDWVPTFDWMPDTSPLPLLEWLFSGGTAAPETAPGPVSAGCAAAAGMSGAGLDHFFPKDGRDWSAQVDGDGLARFLRAAHPAKTAIHVAARTRLPADTVKKWLGGAALPNGRAVLVLACCYGPELLCAMLRDPPGWLDASARGAAQARIEARLAALQAQLRRAP